MMDTARTIAKKSGSKVSFDFNYRSKLWDMQSAREGTQSWVCESDIVFFAKRDATAWLGIPADSDDRRVVDELLTLRGGKATVITLGGRGAIGGEDDKTVYVRTLQLDGLDRSGGGVGRLGGGDAFSAGVLYGHLQGWSLEKSLRWGNAMAGIKYSIPGDLPVIQRSEVSRFVDQLEKLSDGADGEASLKLGVNR
jgi:2-dehydro-3-deoxygluconokinase